MLSPKGAGFLHVRKEVQHLVDPLVVSWGYGNDPKEGTGSRFIDILQWTGTKDPCAALAVPDAIRFMYEHNWDEIRAECHSLLRMAVEGICGLVGLPPLYPLDSDFYSQMAIAPLPPDTDLVALMARLYDEYKVEVPLIEWNGHKFIRISVQGYNTQDDVSALMDGLRALL
jgi:isopenicillin-N epimerase